MSHSESLSVVPQFVVTSFSTLCRHGTETKGACSSISTKRCYSCHQRVELDLCFILEDDNTACFAGMVAKGARLSISTIQGYSWHQHMERDFCFILEDTESQ